MNLEQLQSRVEELDSAITTLNDRIASVEVITFVNAIDLIRGDVIIINNNKKGTIADIYTANNEHYLNARIEHSTSLIEIYKNSQVMCIKSIGDILKQ